VPNLASTSPDWDRGFNSSITMELPLYDVLGSVLRTIGSAAAAPGTPRARGHASTMGKAGNCRRFAALMASRLYFWFAHYFFA